MPQSKSRKKRQPKRVLTLPDLEQAKTAVLNSLTSASGRRTYDHALASSSPSSARNRCSRLTGPSCSRYRIHLEQQGYAPATINLRHEALQRACRGETHRARTARRDRQNSGA